MAPIDLNLLTALDALLAERSVTGAALRLGLSVSATSRTLARLRAATGDPLLVQAGRVLVPHPMPSNWPRGCMGWRKRRARFSALPTSRSIPPCWNEPSRSAPTKAL
jgi:hypothetical protein